MVSAQKKFQPRVSVLIGICVLPGNARSIQPNSFIKGAVVAGFTIIAAQIVDHFTLVPFMISRRVRLKPLLTIMLVLVSAQLIGMIGIILAVPACLVCKFILRSGCVERVDFHDPKAAHL